MSRKIFINLPVVNLDKSKTFFKALGFAFNAQFTDDTAASMVISDDIYAMLLTHAKFKQFTTKAIVDAQTATEVIVCLAVESKGEVDDLAGKALEAGGKEPRPVQDYGFMYQRTFEDLDGHTWEIVWMDPAHVRK